MLRSMKNLLQRVNRGRFNRVAGLVSLIGASALFSLSGCAPPADAQGGPPQAPPVSVAPAVQRSVSDSEEFSGRLEAIDFVELRPRVSGTIDKVHFVDGALVRKGDLLFTIDPRPFEAELARAQSQLASTKAKSELAQSELARARTLLAQQAASKEEVDQLSSSSRTSQADIQGAEAALRVASLNVGYTQVRAPIAGRASRALITAGNLVNEQSVLTSIAGVSRVYAYFDGSEQTYLRLRGASPDQLRIKMALSNETGFPHTGRVDFIDNRLNPQTGAIRMRGVFDNSKGEFVPGLFARMQLSGEATHDAVLTPERAIGTDQSKRFVLVAGANNTAEFREVKLGALYDGMRVVESGLKAGELVVVNGLQRVRPGAPMTPEKLEVDERGMPIEKPAAAPAAPGAKS